MTLPQTNWRGNCAGTSEACGRGRNSERPSTSPGGGNAYSGGSLPSPLVGEDAKSCTWRSVSEPSAWILLGEGVRRDRAKRGEMVLRTISSGERPELERGAARRRPPPPLRAPLTCLCKAGSIGSRASNAPVAQLGEAGVAKGPVDLLPGRTPQGRTPKCGLRPGRSPAPPL